MRRFAVIILVIGSYQELAFAAPAEQPSDAVPATTASPEASRDASAAATEPGEQLMSDAKARYRQRDFAGAIELLQQCYELTHDANVLFNIAQVYRELDDCERAVRYYQLYVEQSPNGQRVADANQFIELLGQRCKANAASDRLAPSPPPSPPPPPTLPAQPAALPTPNYWTPIMGISFGASLVSAVAFAHFAVETHRAKRDVEQTVLQPHFDGRYLNTRLDDFYRDRNWAVGTGIACGVTAGLGTLALAEAVHARNERLRNVSIVVSPRGTSIGVQVHF